MTTPVNQPSAFSAFMMGLRPFMIGLLVLLFLIPLNMVSGVVNDRISFREEAVSSITTGWAGPQKFAGPILIIPYTVTESYEISDAAGKKTVTHRDVPNQTVILPETLKIDADLNTKTRTRGLYDVPVYIADVRLEGNFADLTAILNDLKKKQAVIGDPFISIMVKDIRGISGAPTLSLAGKSYNAEPGTNLTWQPGGISMKVTIKDLESSPLPFSLDLDLKGLGSFGTVPLGDNTTMTVASNWPHPSFSGTFLPDTRDISDTGFKAEWKTGLLATNVLQYFNECRAINGCDNLQAGGFEVGLFQPVDIYTQSTRAVKYGLLFVAVTFALFFVIEATQGIRLSLPHFLLVGAALAIFFLLLLSLSEQVGFAWAYLIAATATIIQIGYYTSYILRTRKRGMMTGIILAAIYGAIYVILLSEDNALLMGSVMLFLLTGGIMIATRHVDWASITRTAPKEKKPL